MHILNFVPINDHWLQDVKNGTTMAKGEDYFRRQRVKLIGCEKEGRTRTLSARVRSANGTDQYAVFIGFKENGDVISCACDCPAFFSYDGPCKHCVATILTYNQFYTNTVVPKLHSLGITRQDGAGLSETNPSTNTSTVAQNS